MARILLGLVAVLALAGCAPTAHPKSATAQSIALQPGDVSGLKGCNGGGDMQTVSLRDAANPAQRVADLSGFGSSLWDIGFTADSRAVGFSWTNPGDPPPTVCPSRGRSCSLL